MDLDFCDSFGRDGWADDLPFYVLFNSISVISGQSADDKERVCAMEPGLTLRRFHLQRGSNPRPLDVLEEKTLSHSCNWKGKIPILQPNKYHILKISYKIFNILTPTFGNGQHP